MLAEKKAQEHKEDQNAVQEEEEEEQFENVKRKNKKL